MEQPLFEPGSSDEFVPDRPTRGRADRAGAHRHADARTGKVVWLSSNGARVAEKIFTSPVANHGSAEAERTAADDRDGGFFPADILHCSGVVRPGANSSIEVVLFLKLCTHGASLSAAELAAVAPALFHEAASGPTASSETAPAGQEPSLDLAAAPPAAMLDALSVRQRDVLSLLVRGMSNKEIARSLKLGEGTVKIHVAALFRKLGLRGRAAVAAEGARLLSKAV
jgi:DNA-binding CsgD family transcriptional regulator